jgi:hypothetical protein
MKFMFITRYASILHYVPACYELFQDRLMLFCITGMTKDHKLQIGLNYIVTSNVYGNLAW